MFPTINIAYSLAVNLIKLRTWLELNKFQLSLTV
jgi:hypothetical protein